jgi:predicted aspartyl protease
MPGGVAITFKDGYTLLPVYINGHGPYQFILDTGSSATIISLELAAALNLPQGKSRTGYGLAESIAGYESEVTAITVGQAELCNVTVAALDCAPVSESVGERVDGYIGNAFLSNFTVSFRYCENEMCLV